MIKLNADLKLAKETHEADRALWNVEKAHIKPRKTATSTNNSISDTQNAKVII